MGSRRLVVVVALAWIGLLVASPAAQAARLTHTDALHDVVRITNDHSVPRPSTTNGDISKLYVNHGLTNLLVKVSFAELLPGTTHTRFIGISINTNEGVNRLALITWYPGRSAQLEWRHKGNIGQPRCSGLKFAENYADNFVLLTVPRTCLSMPLKVRTGVAYHRAVQTYQADDWVVDDANRSGGPVAYYGTLGGWVPRG